MTDDTQRYQLGECIGRGGLGAVFRAWDARLGRWVAVKRLTIDPALGAPQVEEKMRREANALAALQHPHVVTVHDFGTDEEGPFVVMELIEGRTLEACVEQAPFDDASFRELARQTLAGVGAAHRAGLLHRDLKPGNVMLAFAAEGTFQVKLLDFGLAKFAPTAMAQTLDQGNGLLGTIPFMAPEQFGRGALDARTDLYALGCVFYYTLSGRHPFDGESVAEIMASHLQHRVDDLARLRPDLPEPLAHWVMRLLSLAPADRPAGAEEALTIFRALTRSETTFVSAGTPAAVTKSGLRENFPWLRFAVPAFATAIMAGLYFLWPKINVHPHGSNVAPTGAGKFVSAGDNRPARQPPGAADLTAPATAASMSATPIIPVPGPPMIPEPAAPAVSASPAPVPALPVDDVPALRERLGQVVEVRGTPIATGRAKSGTVVFLNFSPQIHEGLSLVFFVNPAAPAVPGHVSGVEDLQRFVGKALVVHGQLSDFKGDLQIVVRSLDQIQLVP